MNSRRYLELCVPPSINDFIHEEYWCLHEAAFALTEWPKYNLILSTVSPALESGRSCIYLSEDVKFNPKFYGEKFEEVFYDLKEAIENGNFRFKNEYIDGLVYLVKPFDVIKWALLKGYILPSILQEAIGVCQDTSVLKLPTKTRNTLPLKVREKVVAQFLLAKEPKQSREKLSKDVCENIIAVDVPGYKRKDFTAIRKNLNELYDVPGKQGRPKDSNKKFDNSYTPKAIQEIIKKDSKGKFYYNFPLFKVAMRQAAYYKTSAMIKEIVRENILKKSKREFFMDFMRDDVVNLYLQENEYLFNILIDCVEEAWSDLITFVSLLEISNACVNRSFKIKNGKCVPPDA